VYVSTSLRVVTVDSCNAAANVLPPPNGLELQLVKLISHPTYRAYQSHIAALSLFPNLYIKLLPPNWNAPTPSAHDPDEREAKEWKRRIRMYSACA
jgi:hypothetical protein